MKKIIVAAIALTLWSTLCLAGWFPLSGPGGGGPILTNLRITNTGAFRITNTGANRAVFP